MTARDCGPMPLRERAMISSRSAGCGKHRYRPGLQQAHVQQACDEMGELVQGLVGGGQEFVMIFSGQLEASGTQAADRCFRRSQRGAQVVADRCEQCCPHRVGVRDRPGRLGLRDRRSRLPAQDREHRRQRRGQGISG